MNWEILAHKDLGSGKAMLIGRGDLFKQPVDCIVNSANQKLSNAGGIAAEIVRRAGPTVQRECAAELSRCGPLQPGMAILTSAGNLGFKAIVHVVAPRMGCGAEGTKIYTGIVAALALASGRRISSIAFPAIGSGLYKVPVDVCAKAYLLAVMSAMGGARADSMRTVRFVLQDEPIIAAVLAALKTI